jgi:CRISPR-associated protein Cas2
MSTEGARRYLVAYDIPDDKRRARIAKRLLTHGDRLQYSVFVVDTRPAGIIRIKDALSDIIKPDEDSILICDLGVLSSVDQTKFMFLGRDRAVTPSVAIIV